MAWVSVLHSLSDGLQTKMKWTPFFSQVVFSEYFITAESKLENLENMYLTGKGFWRPRCQELCYSSMTSSKPEDSHNLLPCQVQEVTLFSFGWSAQGHGMVTTRTYCHTTASKAGKKPRRKYLPQVLASLPWTHSENIMDLFTQCIHFIFYLNIYF